MHRKHSFTDFYNSRKARSYHRILRKNKLPVPLNGLTIAKALHLVKIPRSRLRFAILWIVNCVPYAARECNLCKEEISKAHLESCAVRSTLPSSEPGKGIDTLFWKALTKLNAPSAVLAVNILYNEVRRAFPKRRLIND